MHRNPPLRQPRRQHLAQRKHRRTTIPPCILLPQQSHHLNPRRNIHRNSFTRPPVRRHLQHHRSTQPTVSHQHLLPKPSTPLTLTRLRNHLSRKTRKIAPSLTILRAEHKRHQSRTALHHTKPKLLCQAVSKSGSPHLRNRQPTRSHHHSLSLKHSGRRIHNKPTITPNRDHLRPHQHPHLS